LFLRFFAIGPEFLMKGTGQAGTQGTGSSSTGSSSGSSSSLVKRDLGTARGHSASCNRGQGPPPPRMFNNIFFIITTNYSFLLLMIDIDFQLPTSLHPANAIHWICCMFTSKKVIKIPMKV